MHRRNLKNQFAFIYWLGFKDGAAAVAILAAAAVILYKIIF